MINSPNKSIVVVDLLECLEEILNPRGFFANFTIRKKGVQFLEIERKLISRRRDF